VITCVLFSLFFFCFLFFYFFPSSFLISSTTTRLRSRDPLIVFRDDTVFRVNNIPFCRIRWYPFVAAAVAATTLGSHRWRTFAAMRHNLQHSMRTRKASVATLRLSWRILRFYQERTPIDDHPAREILAKFFIWRHTQRHTASSHSLLKYIITCSGDINVCRDGPPTLHRIYSI